MTTETKYIVAGVVASLGVLALLLVGCCFPVEPGPVIVAPENPPVMEPEVIAQEFPVIVPEEVSYPVVHILTEHGARGTGAIVGQYGNFVYVLSAFHIFELNDGYTEAREVNVLGPDPAELTSLSVALFDEDADLVILTGSAEGHIFDVAAIADRSPEIFEPIVSAGTFPGWPAPMVFRGHVSVIGEDNINPIVTSPAFPGASGGPVYVHQDGEWKVWAVTRSLPMVCLLGVCDFQDNTHIVSPAVDFLQGTLP